MRKRRTKRIPVFDISIGWRHWDCYSRLSKWVFSVHSLREPSEIAQPSKPSPIRYLLAGVTFLGLYTEIERHNMGKLEIGTIASVLGLLRDAEFIKASKNSVFFCWIKTSDGVMHAMTGSESFRLSLRGGKGPARFRKWREVLESKGNGSSQPNKFEGQAAPQARPPA